ncbi:related to channel protein [Ustilago trichophora]|uniref:Related to channel protein n=1 Tax=Ustilago trichophora TaxID=86804 RepID=A0A5C3E7V1_9BASI|nr:related to channel protein [Ustilago trichophora]
MSEYDPRTQNRLSEEEVAMEQDPTEDQDAARRSWSQDLTTLYRSKVPTSDRQPRLSNNIRPQKLHALASSASTTPSGAPSSSQTHTSYASFPSQHSQQAPSTPSTQSSIRQTLIRPRLATPSAGLASTAPQDIRGYQNITSVEPAPKRPLWSLGSTLPRVRRLPAKPTKTAYPTPGSRSNIVLQPPTTTTSIMQPAMQTAGDTTTSPGGPSEPVHGHDYASTIGNESYNAEGITGDDPDLEEVSLNLTTSGSSNAGTGDLPPIREGEPLPTQLVTESTHVTSDVHARPRLDHSFSSPMAAEAANIHVVGGDQLRSCSRVNRQSKQSARGDPTPSADLGQQDNESSDPQKRLSAARMQLVEEAQHGDGLLAMQESAIDANDDDEQDDESGRLKAHPSLNGATSHPASKHVKTSSMPFLPSQGFNVLVAESSHKGADQLNTQALERKRSRADLQDCSAMDKTRHPGLSGARPTPRGRAAGGPAAGIGIRKPSTQSNRRASNDTNEDRNAAGYFDDDVPLHELIHLDRHGSNRCRRGSQQSHQTEENHFEPRPVGGWSSTHRSSTGRDTRSAWMSRNMPSQSSRQSAFEGRCSKEDEDGRCKGLQQAVEHDARKGAHGDEGGNRQSEETAYSASSAERSGEVGQARGQSGEDAERGLEEDEKGCSGEEDELWLGGQGTLADGSIAFPTIWSRWRYHSREFLAELLATMLLITVGTAVDCQVTLSQSMGSSAGAYPNQNWAWGIAVASTIYLSGGRSGAHCNPAITLALAVFRGFPWIQVPIYWSAQLLGSILGAAITYGIYLPAINQYEGGSHVRTLSGEHGTGRLFVTVPELVFTAASGFGTEVVATSILMAMVLAVGDETNAPPSDGLSALVLGFVVVMIGMSFGWPTSYAISPSRDLGPRLFLYMVGYGKELWTHNSCWWIYGPQVGCFTGGPMGALLYDLAIFTGEESPINYTKQGWRQSTPARVGSRLLNSAERLEFWTSPLRGVGRGRNISASGDAEGLDNITTGDGSAASVNSRAGSAGVDTKLDRRTADARPADVADGQARRHSGASQQLDAQELGHSHSAFAGLR